MSDLDVSWIQETERIQNLSESPTKENSSYINTGCVYLNMNNCIENVVYDNLTLKDISHNEISKEQMLEICDKYKKKTATTKYILKYSLLFHIGVEPEDISSFAKCESNKLKDISPSCLHHYHSIDTIKIPPSLFIFHPINTLYFIFQEEESHETKASMKSILKSDNSKPYSERHKFTKRVKINVPRNTRKQRE